ncbi:MAG: hypothetical protein GY707_02605 [Desulfobacteraceae bacterium]|nr:hypothetical protein [Desulfobacteraceae bacterium]
MAEQSRKITNQKIMITKKEREQQDPVEKTMRRVVWGFIAISTVISLIYLWFDSQ